MALRQLVYSLRSVASATPFRVVIATAGFASMSGAVAWMKLRSFVSAEQAGALHPKEFRRFKVRDVEHISHNTARYRFDLPSPDDVLGLTVASCLVVRAPIGENGKLSRSVGLTCIEMISQEITGPMSNCPRFVVEAVHQLFPEVPVSVDSIHLSSCFIYLWI